MSQVTLKHPGMDFHTALFYARRNGNWWTHGAAATDIFINDLWVINHSGIGQVAATTGGHIWPGHALGVGPGASPATNNSTSLPIKVVATETGTIRIVGINNVGVIAYEDLAIINGTTTSVSHYYRLLDVRCISGFATTRNSAVITLYGNNATAVMGYIPATFGKLSCSSFHVPAGYSAQLLAAKVTKSSATSYAGIFSIAVGDVDGGGGSTNNVAHFSSRDGSFNAGLSYAENTTIVLAGDPTTTGVDFGFEMEILLIKN